MSLLAVPRLVATLCLVHVVACSGADPGGSSDVPGSGGTDSGGTDGDGGTGADSATGGRDGSGGATGGSSGGQGTGGDDGSGGQGTGGSDTEPGALEVSITGGPGADSLVVGGDLTFTVACSPEGCTMDCRLTLLVPPDEEVCSGCAPEPRPIAAEACDDGSFTVSQSLLPHGDYLFEVDAFGDGEDPATASRQFTYESELVQVTIDDGPATPTTSQSPSFSASCDQDGCTLYCSLDGAEFTLCSMDGSSIEYEGVSEGAHTLAVRGEVGGVQGPPAEYTWTIDLTPPAPPTIDVSTADPSTAETLEVGFSCSEPPCTFWCRLGDDPFLTCDEFESFSVWNGTNRLEVFAEDEAGNEGESSVYEWSVAGLTRQFAEIFAGGDHGCAIEDDGELWCWGDNVWAQVDEAAGWRSSPRKLEGGDWITAALGQFHTCGIRDEDHDGKGTLWCWGRDYRGALGHTQSNRMAQVGTDSDWVSVSAGYNLTCGIRDDAGHRRLFCWGAGTSGQVGHGSTGDESSPEEVSLPSDVDTDLYGPEDFEWYEVAPGSLHTCGIGGLADTGERRLYCWGSQVVGRLGNGLTTGTANVPQPVTSGVDDWQHLAAGLLSTCAIDGAGQLYCWGSNTSKQAADPTATSISVPQQVGSSTGWIDVTVGDTFACGIDGSTTYCWGSNKRHQLGNTSPQTATLTPISGADGALRVTAGLNHACVRTSGSPALHCWGNDGGGQLGRSTARYLEEPAPVSGHAFQQVDVEHYGGCGISTTGELLCWGADELTAPDATYPDQSSPYAVSASTPWLDVGVSQMGHACAILAAGANVHYGDLYCWGYNLRQAAGSGANPTYGPQRIGTDSDWVEVDVGQNHSCGIRESGGERRLFCWGYNLNSQLGVELDSGTSTPTPQEVTIDEANALATDWLRVAGGSNNTCAIRGSEGSGSLWCWGSGGALLGDIESAETSIPQRIGTDADWTDLSLGSGYVCGLRGSGASSTLWCWGNNADGQLGTGDLEMREAPTEVSTDPGYWLEVDGGYGTTCARRSDNTLWCWGANTYAVSGTGTPAGVAVPTPTQEAAGLTTWTTLAVGFDAACAIGGASGTTLACWGHVSGGETAHGLAWTGDLASVQ